MRNEAREHERADQTREKILDAAVHQFSQHGLAGARTDAISKAAGVNKALLYYYFKNKSSLYRAALKDAAAKIMKDTLASLDAGESAGENLLRLVLKHFDRISSQREFQAIMQQEMVRFHRGESEMLPVLVRSFYGPMMAKMQAVIYEGIRAGELCEADWMQILYAALGANVFYFLSAPVMRLALSFEPLEPSALDCRRKAAIEFLGQALFRDRSHGAKLAQLILADTPSPRTAAKLASQPAANLKRKYS